MQDFLFGLPNSGAVSEYSIFKLEAASATSGFFYDVGFGVEGSIGSTLVLAVVLAAKKGTFQNETCFSILPLAFFRWIGYSGVM